MISPIFKLPIFALNASCSVDHFPFKDVHPDKNNAKNKNNKYLIYHNKDIEKKENTTYKKDESDLIKILKSIIEEPKSKIFNISNNRILVLNCNNQEVCNYTISNSKNKIYRYGEVIIKDNELKRYEDFTKKVKIESMSFANLNYKLN